MVQGTMKWTSPTREFGLLTPDDGSRDIFVRFADAIASMCTRMDGRIYRQGCSRTNAATTPVESSVEVRTRYLPGQWEVVTRSHRLLGWVPEYGARGRWTPFRTSSCRKMCEMLATDSC